MRPFVVVNLLVHIVQKEKVALKIGSAKAGDIRFSLRFKARFSPSEGCERVDCLVVFNEPYYIPGVRLQSFDL